MDTADIFICARCALPIRDPGYAAAGNPAFLCERCEVCKDDARDNIKVLETILRGMLLEVLAQLYWSRHDKRAPPPAFLDRLASELDAVSEADGAIESIRVGLQPGKSQDHVLRNIVRSEKMLSEFAVRSGRRHFIARSPTALRHWAALRRKLDKAMQASLSPDGVLDQLSSDRYVLNLERMSKLLGDNPICINRDAAFYHGRTIWNERTGRSETRAEHLRKHADRLKSETATMRPNIATGEIGEVLRFAGNACFITKSDEIVEFRERKTKHLCKYLLKGRILIVVNDLRCLQDPTPAFDRRALPELVSIHPRAPAQDLVITHLANGRYLPNCIDLDELAALSDRVEMEFLTSS